jgi:hypothetical protein
MISASNSTVHVRFPIHVLAYIAPGRKPVIAPETAFLIVSRAEHQFLPCFDSHDLLVAFKERLETPLSSITVSTPEELRTVLRIVSEIRGYWPTALFNPGPDHRGYPVNFDALKP